MHFLNLLSNTKIIIDSECEYSSKKLIIEHDYYFITIIRYCNYNINIKYV